MVAGTDAETWMNTGHRLLVIVASSRWPPSLLIGGDMEQILAPFLPKLGRKLSPNYSWTSMEGRSRLSRERVVAQ